MVRSGCACSFLEIILVFLILLLTLSAASAPKGHQVPKRLKDEIASYKNTVQDIIDFVTSGSFKGLVYDELAKFIDKFGPRPSGTKVLEDSIDYMIDLTKSNGVVDVTTEEIVAPYWIRKEESLTMLKPVVKNIALIGLGYSISTPPGGVIADVLAVKSFEELQSLGRPDVEGKIVLFVEEFVNYGETVRYRVEGAVEAAKKGAVAALIKSVTPFSMYTPHTGAMSYDKNVTKIPAAAITLEDGDLIKRTIDRGEKVQLHLLMLNSLIEKKSRNTFINRKGSQNPEKLVIVSGHIDSWDIGTGAMDDGGGMMISWAVPIILKELGLTPKRTVQTILWTSEELGLIGAYSYAETHKHEFDKINFVMESDEGTFTPLGLGVAGSKAARSIIAEILQLFTSINATRLEEQDYPGTDIIPIISKGVPGASLLNKNDNYFWFHHSAADMMNVEDTRELDLCAAFWAAVAYVIADISEDIPRS